VKGRSKTFSQAGRGINKTSPTRVPHEASVMSSTRRHAAGRTPAVLLRGCFKSSFRFSNCQFTTFTCIKVKFLFRYSARLSGDQESWDRSASFSRTCDLRGCLGRGCRREGFDTPRHQQLFETSINHAVQTFNDIQFPHQAVDGRSSADIDQLMDVSEFLPSLLVCDLSRSLFTGKEITYFRVDLNLSMARLHQFRNTEDRQILLAPSQTSHVGDNILFVCADRIKLCNEIAMQFFERFPIFTGKKHCGDIAPVFESGMNLLESNRHRVSLSNARITL